MANEEITPRESMQIMEDALRIARREKGHAAYYLTLWGALLVFFFLFSYAAEISQSTLARSLAWLAFPVGGLLSFLHTRKTDRTEKAKPVHDSLYSYCWGGTGLGLGVWALAAPVSDRQLYIPVLLLLFGFAAFVTGGVTRFRPSLAGGVLAFLIAAASLHIASPLQSLAAAAGMLVSALMPGLWMAYQNKKGNA